ncbi:hypothetical protein K7432_012423 [Basidiobolus ranarum]|uniref:Uncharacterized protein n=1 Tax=Basidiobolus ranarum TaxID=34480 RepID=A0ABR2VT59_9FUNG
MLSLQPTSLSPSDTSSNDEGELPQTKEIQEKETNTERWKRLQSLKRRREEVRGGGKQQRKKTSQLKKRILKRVERECASPEREVISSTSQMENDIYETITKEETNSHEDSKPFVPRKLATYLNPNPQLKENEKTQAVKQLERAIDEKVECGALKEAQSLNERLIRQLQEERLLEAMEARDFHIKQQETEFNLSKPKKPKLKWTFVGKERWEAKGNM